VRLVSNDIVNRGRPRSVIMYRKFVPTIVPAHPIGLVKIFATNIGLFFIIYLSNELSMSVDGLKPR